MKHGNKVVLFKDVICHVCYQPKQVSSLEGYITKNNCILPHLSLNMLVYSYGAIIANNKDLVDAGNFVQVSQPQVSKATYHCKLLKCIFLQIQYGVMLTIIQGK